MGLVQKYKASEKAKKGDKYYYCINCGYDMIKHVFGRPHQLYCARCKSNEIIVKTKGEEDNEKSS